MTTPVLNLRSVTAGWSGVPVVRDIDLHVDAGEVVALLGPNGAGKTTLVSTIASLIRPLGGTIEILRRPVEGLSKAHRMVDRGLGVVPDDRGVFSRLTVSQHLRLPRRPQTRSNDWTFTLFPELAPKLNTKVGLLSGGEQQMMALAKVLLGAPKVLVVDEMSLGLAPIAATRIGGVIRQLALQEGVGVLLIEQQVHLALSIADRAVVINGGRVVLEGASDDIGADPARLTAAYLPTTSEVVPDESILERARPREPLVKR